MVVVDGNELLVSSDTRISSPSSFYTYVTPATNQHPRLQFDDFLIQRGFAGGKIEKVAMNKILLRNISLVGVYWGMYTSKEPETVVATRDGLAKLIADGKFKPVEFTDQQFVGLETLPAALHALESRDTWGRVVVKTLQHGQSKI